MVAGAGPAFVAPAQAAAAPSCPPAPYGVNSTAPGTGKTVALTFDDGPGATTMQILSVLQQYRVPATFFNIGVNEVSGPQIVRAEAGLGDVLGNHTWDHANLTTLTGAAQGADIDAAAAEQEHLVGFAPCLLRPPGGHYDTTTLQLAYARHLAVWTWSVDTEDWKAGSSASAYWVNQIVTRAEAGVNQAHPVILMHNPAAAQPATAAALPAVITFYRSHGYTFVDLLGHTGYGVPAPAAVASTGGLHLFTRGSNGALYERNHTRSGWTGWLALGGQLVGGPSATAAGASTTVAVLGTNNQVYVKTISDSGAVTGWLSLGGTATSKPTLTLAPNGVLSVAVRGPHGAVWLRERRGTNWSAWQNIGGTVAGAPAVASTSDSALTVVAAGLDHALWSRHRTGTAWSSWHRVGGVLTADPALSATVGGTHLVAVVSGPAATGYVKVADATAGSWTGWQNVGGVLASGPAVTPDAAMVDAFVYGVNGLIYQNTASHGTLATGWSGWRQLAG